MRASTAALGCTLALVLALMSQLYAHHSAAATYDADRTERIAGKVVSFAWKNPHCHLYVRVSQGSFKGQQYTVEFSSAEALAATGWSKTLLHPGDDVVLEVRPARTGAPIGLCRNCPITINGRARPRANEAG